MSLELSNPRVEHENDEETTYRMNMVMFTFSSLFVVFILKRAYSFDIILSWIYNALHM